MCGLLEMADKVKQGVVHHHLMTNTTWVADLCQPANTVRQKTMDTLYIASLYMYMLPTYVSPKVEDCEYNKRYTDTTDWHLQYIQYNYMYRSIPSITNTFMIAQLSLFCLFACIYFSLPSCYDGVGELPCCQPNHTIWCDDYLMVVQAHDDHVTLISCEKQ